MYRAQSRARLSPPLPFLSHRHPVLALLARWPLFRRWLSRRPRHRLV